MDYSRAILLLSILSKYTNKNRLRYLELFRDAVTSSQEYRKLMNYLQNTNFIGIEGTKILDQSNAVLNKTISEIEYFKDNLVNIYRLNESIDFELRKIKELVESPGFFVRDFYLVDKEDMLIYFDFYKNVSKSIIYHLLINRGTSALEGLIFSHKMELKELAMNVNYSYAEALFQVNEPKNENLWSIKKVNLSGGNLFNHSGFILEKHLGDFEAFKNSMDIDKYRRLSPNFYVSNVIDHNPIYFGYGNIIGVDFDDILTVLNSRIMTKIMCNKLYLDLNLSEPIQSISKALGSSNFCITSGNFTEVLNHASLQIEVKRRNNANVCCFCGKKLNSLAECENRHISIKRN